MIKPNSVINRIIIIIISINTFFGTRYLSHCCAVFCNYRSFFNT